MKVPKVEVDDLVVVEVYSPCHLLPALYPNASSKVVYEGFVRRSEAYDPTDSFRITGTGEMPVRVIAWQNVIALNGEPIENDKTPKPTGVFRTTIPGSKGKQYKVEIDEKGNATCECTGFGFRRMCKHCDQAREQLAQLNT